MTDDLRPPYRIAFDNARDPYTARNTLGAATNPVPTAQIADGAITTAKIADGAVTNAKLAPVWTSYTPTITANTGTFTSVSAIGKYLTIGKLTHVNLIITVTTNGTAAGWIKATLPHTSVGNYCFAGQEIAVNGKGCVGTADAGEVAISYYDGTYPGLSGGVFIMSGVYENA